MKAIVKQGPKPYFKIGNVCVWKGNQVMAIEVNTPNTSCLEEGSWGSGFDEGHPKSESIVFFKGYDAKDRDTWTELTLRPETPKEEEMLNWPDQVYRPGKDVFYLYFINFEDLTYEGKLKKVKEKP